MADQLAAPEDLAALLQQDLDRATAELLIECATAVVQAAANGQRILQVVNDQVQLDLDEHDGGPWVRLPQRPVTAVASVAIGTLAISDWSPQLTRSRLFRPSGWRSTLVLYPGQPTTVSVTYTHGYPDGDQRLQLARSAVLSLAGQGYGNPDGAVREQIDDYAVQYAEMNARMEASPTLMAALRKQYGFAGNSAQLVTR